ncbi:multiple epidermal growth factor-like domains protein 10, partial [Saccostrea cucullata]|uniref:multiple epidermal growth factor-like domains protein 10 n=1 Tax=Saccostrea cuccullata TaxID=36930 RepID=UPI002ED1E135
MINTKRCTISCDNFEMSLELMFFLIFGIIVIHSPKVEGQCKYLPNSTHVCMCHCHSNCRHGCQTCDLGWSGSKQLHCQKENIVYHKRTWQENTYSSKFDSSQAVDGNLQTYSRVQETEGAIWWRVRLDGDHSITRINVTMDWVPNIEYDVYVTHDSLVTNSHSLCDTEKSHSDQMRSVVFECSRAMIGSTIEIQAPPHVPLTIYEVSSVSCTVGTHGEECDILCPKECHRSCNKITGKCDQCPAGQFGDSCNLNCSKFCGKSGCDRTTGQCYQCATNLWGPNCTKYCHNACSLHCQRETGHCRVCQSGHRFNGTTCEQCPSGSYGVNCSQKCATKCKDEVCDAETGKCSDCKEWFYGTF